MAEPLYSQNVLAQFARQNTPYGLFGAGTWRAPAGPAVGDPTQQGGRYGAQLDAPRPSYSAAQLADLPGIVNTPTISQEAALAALQALSNAPTPNPVQANPTQGGGQSNQGPSGILGDLGTGSGGQFPWTPPPGQAPAPPAAPVQQNQPSRSIADYDAFRRQFDNVAVGGAPTTIGGYQVSAGRLGRSGGIGYQVIDPASNTAPVGILGTLSGKDAVLDFLLKDAGF